MAEWVSQGKCNLCGNVFAKAGMTRHIAKCRTSHQLKKLEGRGRAHQAQLFHIVVEGRHAPMFWLHLEAPADATLRDLDQFLRDIWLECCGHLSAFTIGNARYEVDTGGIDGMWTEIFGSPLPPQSMNVTLGSVFSKGTKFLHEYDFGTTTELAGKVAAEYEGTAKGKSVQILARNEMPPIVCEQCDEPATLVCSNCIWSGEGWLCDEHAFEHECGEDICLPVVNSPRVGMCGYTGDAY